MSDPWPSEPPVVPPSTPSYPGAWRPVPPTLGEPATSWAVRGAAPETPGGGGRFPRDLRHTAVLVVGIVAAVILVLGSLWIVTRRDRSDSVASGSTTTTQSPATTTTVPGSSTTTSPSSPSTTVGPSVTQAELDAAVAELSRFVAQQRGLAFKAPVRARLATGDEFDELLLRDFEEDTAELERETAVLESFGLLPPGTDVRASLRSLLSAGVLGFYDPETDELVVRGAALTPFVKQTLVHELVHALDDQHFDLDRPEYDERRDELAFGFSSVVEGNARRIETAWTAQLTPEQQQQRDREERQFGLTMDLSGIPEILIILLTAPYELGEPLVDGIVQELGQAGLDALIGAPPDTTEQVLHPDKLRAREPRVEVPRPPADGEVTSEGVFGEFLLGTMLSGSSNAASTAAAGWAGDWYVTWTDEQRGACARMTVRMDTTRDLDELLAALEDWLDDNPQAEVSTLDPQQVEITSCIPSQAGGGSSPL